MRVPRSLPTLLVCALAVVAGGAQSTPNPETPNKDKPAQQDTPIKASPNPGDAPQWKSRVVTDTAQGTSYVELTLQGTYLVPPTLVDDAQPALVVQCANGKILENLFSFGAVLSLHVGGLYHVELQTRIDDVKRPIIVDDLNADRTAAFFSRGDLKRILDAKHVVVFAVEFAGPQMQASFTMPPPAPIFAACGQDWVLTHSNDWVLQRK